jgi:hypothetical protein
MPMPPVLPGQRHLAEAADEARGLHAPVACVASAWSEAYPFGAPNHSLASYLLPEYFKD